MTEKIHQGEDKTLKNIFSHDYIIKEFVKYFIKGSWKKELDLNSFELINKEFISADMKDFASDCIWKVKYKNKEMYLIFLIEFQSSTYEFMAVRMLNYITLFYLDYIKQNPNLEKLPTVFPVLFYTGEKDWKDEDKIEKLIQITSPNLKQYVPTFKYYKVIINEFDKEKIRKIDSLVLKMISLDLSNNVHDFKEIAKELEDLLNTKVPKNLRSVLGKEITLYFNKISKNKKELTIEEREGKMILYSKLEKWEQELKQEGFEKGIEQGIEQGIEKGAYLEKINTAKELLLIGTDVRFIAKITKLSIDEIEKIQKEMNTTDNL